MPMTTVRDYLYDVGSNAGANFASAYWAAQSNKTQKDANAAKAEQDRADAEALERWRQQQLEMQRQQQALDQAKAERAAAMDTLKMQEMTRQQGAQQQFQQGFQSYLGSLPQNQGPTPSGAVVPAVRSRDEISEGLMQSALSTGDPDLIFNAMKQVESIGSPQARPIFDELSGTQIGNVFKNTVIPVRPEAGGFAPVIPEGATDIIGWQQKGSGRFVPKPAQREMSDQERNDRLMFPERFKDGPAPVPSASPGLTNRFRIIREDKPQGQGGTVYGEPLPIGYR